MGHSGLHGDLQFEIYLCYISTEKNFKLFKILDFAIVGESYG